MQAVLAANVAAMAEVARDRQATADAEGNMPRAQRPSPTVTYTARAYATAWKCDEDTELPTCWRAPTPVSARASDARSPWRSHWRPPALPTSTHCVAEISHVTHRCHWQPCGAPHVQRRARADRCRAVAKPHEPPRGHPCPNPPKCHRSQRRRANVSFSRGRGGHPRTISGLPLKEGLLAGEA